MPSTGSTFIRFHNIISDFRYFRKLFLCVFFPKHVRRSYVARSEMKNTSEPHFLYNSRYPPHIHRAHADQHRLVCLRVEHTHTMAHGYSTRYGYVRQCLCTTARTIAHPLWYLIMFYVEIIFIFWWSSNLFLHLLTIRVGSFFSLSLSICFSSFAFTRHHSIGRDQISIGNASRSIFFFVASQFFLSLVKWNDAERTAHTTRNQTSHESKKLISGILFSYSQSGSI